MARELLLAEDHRKKKQVVGVALQEQVTAMASRLQYVCILTWHGCMNSASYREGGDHLSSTYR